MPMHHAQIQMDLITVIATVATQEMAVSAQILMNVYWDSIIAMPTHRALILMDRMVVTATMDTQGMALPAQM